MRTLIYKEMIFKMKSAVKNNFSPSLVISIVALIVALGGTAYAGVQLGKNSVGTPQLKNGAVKTSKLGGDVKKKLNKVGARGPQGERGPQGVAGQNGQNGQDGQQGLQGPPGMVNWNSVYEVVATRVGTGVVTATCTGDDQVLFGTTSADSDYHVSNASRGNAGRQWSVTIQSSPGVNAKAIAYCAPA